MTARAILLVEGQTEERFVKDVLEPFFRPRELSITATLLTTKKVKNGPTSRAASRPSASWRTTFGGCCKERVTLG